MKGGCGGKRGGDGGLVWRWAVFRQVIFTRTIDRSMPPLHFLLSKTLQRSQRDFLVFALRQSVEGAEYSILTSTDLSQGDLNQWTVLDANFPAAAGGNITTFTETDLPLDTSKRFYVIQRVGR